MATRVSADNFEQRVIRNVLPVVVDFYSDSCLPCKMLSPVLGEIEDNYEGRLEVVKVNTNFESELNEKYKILSNPTILFFKNGQEVERLAGFHSYEELESIVSKYICQ